ncbi:MAG TPA: outer membrane lipid asymmetry maintenance protein MlaD, partial [Nitrospirae bacterium]|nr:outer membrane lipid asymmetry maintenance protein MlaD [Nitrospirota bacterium]
VELLIAPDVKLQEDSIASIRTQGIIGDKYIKISPGGAEEFIEPGGEIFETESTIDLEELVGKYIFDKE